MSFCFCSNGSSSKVLVHGEFQQYVKYKDVGKSAEGKTHRRYEVEDLSLGLAYPNSNLDLDLQGKIRKDREQMAKDAQAVRVFRFLTNGEARVLEIRHKDCHWYIVIDGIVKRVVNHESRMKDKTTIPVSFEVPEYRDEVNEVEHNRKGKTLAGVARMRWSSGKAKWGYAVSVNNIPIPAMWSIFAEDTQKSVYLPDVISENKNIYTLEELCKGNHEWRRIFDEDEMTKAVTTSATVSNVTTGNQDIRVLDEYKTVRLWRFTMDGQLRGVEVAHRKAVWSILVDGIEVKRMNRSEARSEKGRYGCDFPIRIKRENGTSPTCEGQIMIRWSTSGFRWEYHLMINGRYVPQCGFKGSPTAPYDFYSIEVLEIPVPRLAVDDSPTCAKSWLTLSWDKSLKDQHTHQETLSKDFGQKRAVASTTPYKAARTYHFTICFSLRTVSVLHSGCIWRFVVDGKKAPGFNVIRGSKPSDGKDQLVHSSNMFKNMHYEVSFQIPFEGGDLTEPLKASCKMTWTPRDARWRYEMKIRVSKKDGSEEFELYPMYDAPNPAKQGRTGSGAIVELIDTGNLGLRGWRPYYEALADAAETILSKLHQAGDNQISIENSGCSLVDNDYIKIEGLTEVDPQEYRQIVSIQWVDNNNGVIALNQVLECTHEMGSKVRRVAHGEVPEEDKEKRCEAELRYILFSKLRGVDKEYGIRFIPGTFRLLSEAETVVLYDIASLLQRFPSYYIKIIGYTAQPFEHDIYGDKECLKYLAMKRCEAIVQRLRYKEVENLIGIEGRGYDPSKPACCVIERSDREEIDELNAKAEEFFKEAEKKGLHKRFYVEKQSDSESTDNVTQRSNFTDNSSLVVSSRFNESHLSRHTGLGAPLPVVPGSEKQLALAGGKIHNDGGSRSFLSAAASTLSLIPSNGNGMRSFSDRETSNLEFRSALEGFGLISQNQIDVINYYKPGEEVEYFSKTHFRWMSAAIVNVVLDEEFQVLYWTEDGASWAEQIDSERKEGERVFDPLPAVDAVVVDEQVEIIQRVGGDLQNREHFRVEVSRCFYDIVFARSRRRKDMVDIDSIRKPLSEDTEVEVYALRDGGCWLSGRINGSQVGGATVGYNVIVHTENQGDLEVERLPAERIRRRFESGRDVQFYVNAKVGWQNAKVAPEAGDGCADNYKPDGVREMTWLYSANLQESIFKTSADTKEQDKNLPGPPDSAKEATIFEEAPEDDQQVMSAIMSGRMSMAGALSLKDGRSVHGNSSMGRASMRAQDSEDSCLYTNRVNSQERPIGAEPWTTVPVLLEEELARNLGLETRLRIELWRLRTPAKWV